MNIPHQVLSPMNMSRFLITSRLFYYPLINEGFKILEQGYVARSSDIDLVCASRWPKLAEFTMKNWRSSPCFHMV